MKSTKSKAVRVIDLEIPVCGPEAVTLGGQEYPYTDKLMQVVFSCKENIDEHQKRAQKKIDKIHKALKAEIEYELEALECKLGEMTDEP